MPILWLLFLHSKSSHVLICLQFGVPLYNFHIAAVCSSIGLIDDVIIFIIFSSMYIKVTFMFIWRLYMFFAF